MSRAKAHNSRRYQPVTSRIDAEEAVAGPDLGLVLAYWLWWSSRTEVCLRSRGLYRQRWSTSQLTRLRTLDEPVHSTGTVGGTVVEEPRHDRRRQSGHHEQGASMSDVPAVNHNPEESRYEITVDGQLAGFSQYLDTEIEGTAQRILFHTEVGKAFGGARCEPHSGGIPIRDHPRRAARRLLAVPRHRDRGDRAADPVPHRGRQGVRRARPGLGPDPRGDRPGRVGGQAGGADVLLRPEVGRDPRRPRRPHRRRHPRAQGAPLSRALPAGTATNSG